MHIIFDATPLTARGIIAAFLDVYGADRPLIIVDTLAKIRPQRGPGADPYQWDYAFTAGLKAHLDGYPGAGLWAVHHSRKAIAEDFVDMASGTNGLAGAADYILVLKHPRLAMHGSLLVTGRDVPEGEYGLLSDQGHGWRLDGDTLSEAATNAEARQQRERLSDRSLEVVTFVSGRTETRAADLKALGIDQEQARVYLNRLADSGHIEKFGRGLYRRVTTVTSVTAQELTDGNVTDITDVTPLCSRRDFHEPEDRPLCIFCGLPVVAGHGDAHLQCRAEHSDDSEERLT